MVSVQGKYKPARPKAPCKICGQLTISKHGICTSTPECDAANRRVASTPGEKERARRRPSAASRRQARQRELVKKREWHRSLKIGKSCVDCGLECTEANWVAFDWDHRPGADKSFNVGQYNRGKAKILAEIAKCDLRCANCHRIITHQRHGELP